MTKSETLKYLQKISGTYPTQFYVTDDVKNAWCEILEPYDVDDLKKRLDEYIKSDYEKPPQLPTLIRHLETIEDKRTKGTDCTIYCDLCGKLMSFKKYQSSHRDKCLLIISLINEAKKSGRHIAYEEFDIFSYDKLEKKYGYLFEKENVFKNIFIMGIEINGNN